MRVRLTLAVLLTAFAGASTVAQQDTRNTVRVVGRIVSVLGQGVPAAEVWVTGDGGASLGRTVADGDGLYQVAPLPAAPLVVHARATGKVEGSIAAAAVGSVRAALLVLEDGEPLHGTVVRADGSAAAGAAVFVGAETPIDAPFDWQFETTTDAKGTWHVLAAPLRPLRVRVWGPGLELTDLLVPNLHAEPVRVVVMPDPAPPRRVRVTGVRAGEDIVVRCRPSNEGGRAAAQFPAALLAAKVAADGTASLWPLPVHHEVSVVAPHDSCLPLLVSCPKQARSDLDFALTPLPEDLLTRRTRLSGQLFDGVGNPLRGINVLAKCDDRRSEPATTDNDGRFVLDAPVRANVLFRVGLAPGSWCLGDPRVELDDDGVVWLTMRADPSAPLRLHAVPAGRIRGVLRTTAGVPLAAARMHVNCRSVRGSFLASSNAAGVLDLVGVPAGSYDLKVIGDDDGPGGTLRLDVPSGGEAAPGVLAAAATGEVRGVVRGTDGRPAAGVMLMLAGQPVAGDPRRRGGSVGGRTILTDREGRFRVPRLTPGDWTVQVVNPADGMRRTIEGQQFTVDAGAVAEVEVSLAR